MKKTVFFSFGLLLILFLSCSKQPQNDQSELRAIVNDTATILVDVRYSNEFESGHPEGSVNIPLNIIENHLEELKDKKHIVVFCRSGKRAGEAKKILEENGFTNVVYGGSWQNVDKLLDEKESLK